MHHDTRVINVGDRLFYRVTQSFALIVILLAFLLVFDLFRGAWEAIQTFGLKFLVGTTWDPVKREFSTLPTVIGTLVKAFIALLLAVPISIGSAIFISFYTTEMASPLHFVSDRITGRHSQYHVRHVGFVRYGASDPTHCKSGSRQISAGFFCSTVRRSMASACFPEASFSPS